MTPSPAVSPNRVRTFFLTLGLLAFGGVSAFLLGEGVVRALGLKAQEAGRLFRISNGANVIFPGRAGHEVIDLYRTNPRGTFPINLGDGPTRDSLIARKFTRVDEARTTNPFGVPFSYNSRGFREREFALRPQGVRRVVFVGDSFTEGMGVVPEASSVRLVERSLRQRDPSVEAWNLGVRAYDFPELEKVLEAALELAPDVVIFAMVLNDGDRDEARSRKWPRINDWIMVRPDPPSWLARRSQLIGLVNQRLETMKVSRDTTDWYNSLYSEDNLAGWMRTRAALQRFQTKCRVRGISFGVALWPLLVGLDSGAVYPFEAAHAQIKKGVERSGIPFVDLLPSLRGHDPETLWVHPSDLHPNEIAQALVTPTLVDFAQKRLGEAASRRNVAK